MKVVYKSAFWFYIVVRRRERQRPFSIELNKVYFFCLKTHVFLPATTARFNLTWKYYFGNESKIWNKTKSYEIPN